MSIMLFIDESGHDHRISPYEVWGGVAISADRVWELVNAVSSVQKELFGKEFALDGMEMKGSKLLSSKKFRWKDQLELLPIPERGSLIAGLQSRQKADPRGTSPSFIELTALGQSSIELVSSMFRLLDTFEARVFAVAIDRGVSPPNAESRDLLRKDLVFLLERFHYYLEEMGTDGMLIMDQSSFGNDWGTASRIARYFRSAERGREWARRILPVPMFVDSVYSIPIQLADLLCYVVNWGFRIPGRGMNAPHREEISTLFAGIVSGLQFRVSKADFLSYSIVYVSDPFQPRK
ncbi:MAG: DUF3800 domain-containing protein [bacterium]